jgi:P-type E1-E2 ATPase
MEYVQKALEKGHIVAMVGDGINDAPALTASHVGISVVTASDLSIQVSDILLTTPNLTVIPKMRKMGNLARLVVNQNLFWAFFYNGVGIAIAAAGLLTPLYAAVAMVLSSLMVVGNAQRIKSL